MKTSHASATLAADPAPMEALRTALLDWYAAGHRDLPWRRTSDPYAILVSEVMLQQTQVARVLPRFEGWLERWPTAEALAAAGRAEVLGAWVGLGYNTRALRLHGACQVIAPRGLADDGRRAARPSRRRAVYRRCGRLVRVR